MWRWSYDTFLYFSSHTSFIFITYFFIFSFIEIAWLVLCRMKVGSLMVNLSLLHFHLLAINTSFNVLQQQCIFGKKISFSRRIVLAINTKLQCIHYNKTVCFFMENNQYKLQYNNNNIYLANKYISPGNQYKLQYTTTTTLYIWQESIFLKDRCQ